MKSTGNSLTGPGTSPVPERFPPELDSLSGPAPRLRLRDHRRGTSSPATTNEHSTIHNAPGMSTSRRLR
jgi:hypothetical protein